MPGIRWTQDYDSSDPWQTGQNNFSGTTTPTGLPDYSGDDERTVGGYTGQGPINSPGKPVAVAPDPGPPKGTTVPANTWWDPNVAAFIPNGVAPSPTGYSMQNGSLVGNSPAPSGGSSDPYSWIDEALRSVSSTDDPSYWRRVIGADPNGNGSAKDYWIDRIRRGDGSALVKSGQLQKFQDGPAGGNVNQFGYDDPSSLLYLSSLMNRLQQLAQPRHDPVNDQLAAFIQQLVAKSQQAPYTAGDDARLTAQYREPLTQARDAAMRQNTEQASRKGYLPSSGLLRRMNTDTQSAYIGGIAKGANDLGVRAVDEQQNRALQAIQALSGLVQNNRQEQDRQDQVANEVLRISALFPQFDERRLDMLLGASGEGPGAAISGLTSLGNLGLNASALNNQNSANSASALADFLYRWAKQNGL